MAQEMMEVTVLQLLVVREVQATLDQAERLEAAEVVLSEELAELALTAVAEEGAVTQHSVAETAALLAEAEAEVIWM
jgi:hypothetical protein